MTAPDAPQVEPLTLTLEEGLKHLWARGFVLVPPDGSTETWGASVADAPDEEWGTWPEAVSAALGRPVVERRDDTAELAEAVAQYVAAVEAHEAYLERNYEVRDAAEDDAAVEQIGKWWGAMKAALARVRGATIPSTVES